MEIKTSNFWNESSLSQLNPNFIQSDWKKKSPFHLNRECWQIKNSSKNNQIVKIQHIKLSAFQNFLQFLNKIFRFNFNVKVTIYTKVVKFEEKCPKLNLDKQALDTLVNQTPLESIENKLLEYIKTTHLVSQNILNSNTLSSTDEKISTIIRALNPQESAPSDDISSKTFKPLSSKKTDEEGEKEGEKTPFEEKYGNEWESLEDDLLQLSSQIDDLEVGKIDLSLTHYAKALGNFPRIVAIYEQMKEQGNDLSALKEIDATLKQMDWTREDFMELWVKESEAEIREASKWVEEALKTFLKGPDPHLNYVDSYRHLKQAIQQLRSLKEMHQRSLLEIQKLNRSLNELSLELPEKQPWTSYLISMVKRINTTIRHPIQSFQEALSFKEEEKIAALQDGIAILNDNMCAQTKKDNQSLSKNLEQHLQEISSILEGCEPNLEEWETLFLEQAALLGLEESELSKLLEAPLDIPKQKAVSQEKQKREKLHEKRVQELKSLEKGTPAWKLQALGIFFLALQAGMAYRILHNVQAQGALVRAAKWKWESQENLKISNEHQVEAAFLANTLHDRQDFVTMSDDRFDAYTKRYPEVKEILLAYRRGVTPLPEKGEIDAIKDAYLYSHFPQSPPDLPDIQSKTLGEWLEAFLTPQGDSVPIEILTPKEPSALPTPNPSELTKTSIRSLAETFLPFLKFTEEPIKLENLKHHSFVQLAKSDEISKTIDDSLYQHILGSYFGKNTGLEGYNDHKMVIYIDHLLKDKIENLKNDPLNVATLNLFENVKQQTETAIKIAEAFDTPKFAPLFRKIVKELKPQESFFFQSGWTSKQAGHSIVYEIIKQENGHYTFRAYNRGAGAKYHAKTSSQSYTQLHAFKERVDVLEDSLTGNLFITALRELRSAPIKGEEWEEKELYEHIFPNLLGGRINESIDSPDQFLKQLNVGHCTYLSLNAFMSQHLGDQPTYARWQTEIELKTFLNYFSQNQQELATNEQTRRLVKYGLEQISRNIKNDYLSDLLTEEEQNLMSSKLQPMLSFIQEAENRYLLSLSYPLTSTIAPDSTLPQNSIKKLPSERFKNDISLPKNSYQAINKADWNYSPQTFTADLNLFFQEIDLARSQKQYANIHEGIKELVLKIPLEGNVFWKNMNGEDAQQALEQLERLSVEYMTNYLHVHDGSLSKKAVTTENMLVCIKILTLADALAKTFQKDFEFALEGLNSRDMMELLEEDIVYIYSQSPAYKEEMRLLRNYWRQRDPDEIWRTRETSFFGFEWGPGETDDRVIFESQIDAKKWGGSYGPEVFYTWPDIEFAKQWISEREEEFNRLYPKFSAGNLLEKACIALGDYVFYQDDRITYDDKAYTAFINDQNKRVLPPSFFSLRKIAMMTHFIERGPLIGWNLSSGINLNNLKINSIRLPEEEKGRWEIKLSFGYHPEAKIIDLDDNYHHEEVFKKQLPPAYIAPEVRLHGAKTSHNTSPSLDSFIAGGEKINLSNDRQIEKNGMRKRISPHEKLVVRLKNKPSFTDISSLEVFSSLPESQTMELLSLSSNQELQIQDTLSYFSKHTVLLEEASYQQLFRYLMQEKDLLIQELFRSKEHAAAFTQKLADFCSSPIERYQEAGVKEQSLYFLELNIEFEALVDYLRDKYPEKFLEKFSNPFKDFRPLLNQFIKDPHLSERARSIASYLLIKSHSHKKDLSIQEVTEIFEAKAQWAKNPLAPTEQGWGMDKAIDESELLRKLRGPLQRALEGPDQNKILQSIVNSLNPKKPNVQWDSKSSFPLFYSQNRKTILNVLEGRYLIEDVGNTALPSKIRNDEIIISLFGKEGTLFGGQINFDSYSLQDKYGHSIRIQEWSGQLIIEREIDGHWYRGFKGSDILDPSFPNRLLRDDTMFWVGDKGNPQTWVTTAKDDIFRYKIQKTELQGPNHQPQNLPETLLSKISHAISAFFNHYGNKQAVFNLNNEREETEEVLLFSHPYSFLNRFEDSSYTLVWSDKTTNQASRIELPRFGLNFDISTENGNPKITCREIPGYRLAPMQLLPSLGDVTTYLLLQEENSDRQLVLMPRVPFQEIGSASLFTTTNIGEYEQISENYLDYFAYKVDKKTGKLIPPNDEARFHLAMAALWERDYENAMHLLRGYGFQREPLSSKEREVLQWIADLDKKNGDESPQSIAVRLFSKYLHLQSHLDRSTNADQLFKTLNDLYDQYLNTQREAGSLQLSIDEEVDILNFLIANSPTLQSLLKAPYFTSNLLLFEENKLFLRLKELNPVFYKQKYNFEIQSIAPGTTGVNKELNKKPDHDTFFRCIRPQIQAKSSLLRSFLAARFTQYYKLLREGNRQGFMSALLADHITMLPSEIVDNKEKDTVQLLWFLRNHLPTDEEKVAAAFLGAAFQTKNLSGFPEAKIFAFTIIASELLHKTRADWSDTFQYAQNWQPDLGLTPADLSSNQVPIAPTKIYPLDPSVSASRREHAVPVSLQTCLRDVFDPFTLIPKTASTLDPYLNQRIKTDHGSEFLKNQELESVFHAESQDRALNEKFSALAEEVIAYGKKAALKEYRYQIKDLPAIKELKADTQKQIEELENLLIDHQNFLEKLADKTHSNPTQEHHRRLKILAKEEHLITLSDLIQLFWKRDRQLFFERNSALTVDDINQLNQEIKKYLIVSTEMEQKKRVVNAIDQIERIDTSQESAELGLALEEFASAVTPKRHYAIENHPEYLNLEHNLQFLLRKDQIDHLELMAQFEPRKGSDSQKNGVALEAIPGSGKTSVLLTLQALNDADGETLPLVVMPESLMPSMSEELQKRLGDTFEQAIEIMEFDRESIFDEQRLSRLLDRFERIIKERKALLITDSSVQSLFLKFTEKVLLLNKKNDPSQTHEPSFFENLFSFFKSDEAAIGNDRQAIENTDPSLIKEISLFREIFTLLRESGKVTIDEMDTILNVLKAHHFTLGTPQHAHEDILQASIEFYALIADEELLAKMPFDIFSEGEKFNPLTYDQEVKPLFVQAILKGKFSQDKEIASFFAKLKPKEKELLAAYLGKEKGEEEGLAFIQSLPSKKMKNLLAIWKEEINSLFPLTASKELNEHYGPLPKSEPLYLEKGNLAIPYHGSHHPVVNAQFGTDLEIIHYTIQMHLKKGISKDIVKEEIELLKTQVLQDISTIGLEASQAYRYFIKLCGGSREFPLFQLTAQNIESITQIVNQMPSIQLDLIKRYALTQLKVYPKQLHTNGQIYGPLFHKVSGFSGTLWNSESFPDLFIDPIHFSDTMGKTLHILWNNSPKTVASIPVSKQPLEEIVSSLYEREGGFKGSFADAGGIFRNVGENRQVAEEILKYQDPSIHGIAFYDQNDRLVVLERGKILAIPLSQCSLPKEELCAYWDQKHTTGSDVKLGMDMTATVSIGQHTMIRDLIQAAWRMRGLEKGQKIDFVVAKEDEVILRSALEKIGYPVADALELKDLLRYTAYLQSLRQGDDNYRSLKQKMQATLLNKALELVVDPAVDTGDVVSILAGLQDLFQITAPEEPFDQYGGLSLTDSKENVMQEELETFLNSHAMQTFKNHPLLKKRFPFDSLKIELEELIKREIDKLPDHISKTSFYGTELYVKTETQTETQIQTETQTEIQSGETKAIVPLPVLLWDHGTLFDKDSYTPSSIRSLKKTQLTSHSLNTLKNQKLTPVVAIQDVFQQEDTLKSYRDIFDSSLIATLNMMPVYPRSDSNQPIYQPFGRYHDLVSYLIVVQNKEGKLTAVLADQADADQVDKLLQRDRKEQKKDINKVCLYNLQNGIVQSGANAFDIQKLESTPHFIQLKTQAKFFGGFLDYSDEEFEVLKKWIQEKGAERMQALFKTVILNNKPLESKAFPNSKVARLFKEFLND